MTVKVIRNKSSWLNVNTNNSAKLIRTSRNIITFVQDLLMTLSSLDKDDKNSIPRIL